MDLFRGRILLVATTIMQDSWYGKEINPLYGTHSEAVRFGFGSKQFDGTGLAFASRHGAPRTSYR
jgi:hypothetical protein